MQFRICSSLGWIWLKWFHNRRCQNMGHAFLECPAEIPFEMIFDLRTSLPSQEIGNSTMWYDWHIHITFIRPGVFAKMCHLCASVGLCGKQQALTPVDIFETPNLFVCFLMQFMQLWPNPTKPAIFSFALLCSALLCFACWIDVPVVPRHGTPGTLIFLAQFRHGSIHSVPKVVKTWSTANRTASRAEH